MAADFDAAPQEQLSALLAALDRYRPLTPTTVVLGPVKLRRIALHGDLPRTAVLSRSPLPATLSPSTRRAPIPPTSLTVCYRGRDSTKVSLHVFSPRATVPLDWLLCQSTAADSCVRRREFHIPSATPLTVTPVENAVATQLLRVRSFRSLVARDDLLLDRIFTELLARGACDVSTAPTIAVVSEQDTLYGRLLDDIFTDIIGRLQPSGCEFRVVSIPLFARP